MYGENHTSYIMYLSNEQIIAHQQRFKSIHFVMMFKLCKSLHGSWKKRKCRLKYDLYRSTWCVDTA